MATKLPSASGPKTDKRKRRNVMNADVLLQLQTNRRSAVATSAHLKGELISALKPLQDIADMMHKQMMSNIEAMRESVKSPSASAPTRTRDASGAFTKKAGSPIKDMLASLWTSIAKGPKLILEGMKKALKAVFKGGGGLLKGFGTVLKNLFSTAFKAGFKLLKFGAIGIAITLFWELFGEKITAFFKSKSDEGGGIKSGIVNVISGLFDSLNTVIKDTFGVDLDALLKDTTGGSFKTHMTSFVNFVGGIVTWVADIVDNIIGDVASVFGGDSEDKEKDGRTGFQKVVDFMKTIFNIILAFGKAIGGGIMDIIDLVFKPIDGEPSTFHLFLQALKTIFGVIKDAGTWLVEGLAGIFGVSGKEGEKEKSTAQKLVDIVVTVFGFLNDIVRELLKFIADPKGTATEWWTKIKAWFSKIFNTIGTWISTKADAVATWMSEKWDAWIYTPISNFFTAISDKLAIFKENVGAWFTTKWEQWTTMPMGEFFANLGAEIVTAAAAIGTWVSKQWTDLVQSPVGQFFINLGIKIGELASAAGTWISEKWEAWVTIPLGKFFTAVSDKILIFKDAAGVWIGEKWELWIVTPIKDFFSAIATSIATFVTGVETWIKTTWDESVVAPVKNFFKSIGKKIEKFVTGIFGGDDGENVPQGEKNDLVDILWGTMKNWIVTVFEDVGKGITNITAGLFSFIAEIQANIKYDILQAANAALFGTLGSEKAFAEVFQQKIQALALQGDTAQITKLLEDVDSDIVEEIEDKVDIKKLLAAAAENKNVIDNSTVNNLTRNETRVQRLSNVDSALLDD